MKDFNEYFSEYFKKMEENLSKIDEKVNEKLSEIYDKLDEYRDTFRKNVSENKKKNGFNFDFGDVTVSDDGTKTVHINKKKEKSEDKFVEMAPFLDNDSLHELVVEFCNSDLETDMAEILPFLEEDDVGLLIAKFSGGVTEFKGLSLEDLFPFADEKSLDGLFMDKLLNGGLDDTMLPYVSDDCWHKLVVKYCEDENCKIDIDEIYPFLNDGDLRLLFKAYLKRRKSKQE